MVSERQCANNCNAQTDFEIRQRKIEYRKGTLLSIFNHVADGAHNTSFYQHRYFVCYFI